MPENKNKKSHSGLRVRFFTFGCKVNQYETQSLMEQAESLGCEISHREADTYVINGCSVTSRADSKAKELIARLRCRSPKAKIALCGCIAQYPEDLKGLDVDYIVPQDKKHRFCDIVLGRERGGMAGPWSLTVSRFPNRRAFVKVQDGCDNFCSFCRVPYLRGPSRSRPLPEVVEEVKRLCRVHPEIVLCGINLGFYGRDFAVVSDLSTLVERLLKLDCLGRLRLSSLEAGTFDNRLISQFAHPRLCPHAHLPFQSGDDMVLKKMNKKVSVAEYKDLVSKLRKINPGMAVSCDMMVGFPGENSRTFANTLKFLEEVRPMRMHIFTFSPRQNTQFASMKIKDTCGVKERYKILHDLGKRFAFEYALQFKGKDLTIVAEEKKDGYILGYSQNYLRLKTKTGVAIGEMARLRVDNVNQHGIYAS